MKEEKDIRIIHPASAPASGLSLPRSRIINAMTEPAAVTTKTCATMAKQETNTTIHDRQLRLTCSSYSVKYSAVAVVSSLMSFFSLLVFTCGERVSICSTCSWLVPWMDWDVLLSWVIMTFQVSCLIKCPFPCIVREQSDKPHVGIQGHPKYL